MFFPPRNGNGNGNENILIFIISLKDFVLNHVAKIWPLRQGIDIKHEEIIDEFRTVG